MEISSIRDWILAQNLIEKAKNQTDPEKYFPEKLWQVSTNITVETELSSSRSSNQVLTKFGPKFTKQKSCFIKALIWVRLL